MKQLAIISGKGGTGKTTVTSSFAVLANNAVVADCDVDAANMHLLLNPQILSKHDFYGLSVASIDNQLCTECGLCKKHCRFDAINDNFCVESFQCEGCGVCKYVCPSDAISMETNKAGEAYESITRLGLLLAHAKLGIGEDASGKLIAVVREIAIRMAEENKADLILIDGPPGTGCAVIATLTGVDLALIVTEPTISGIHDLERALEVTSHFNIPALVCINKYDINEEMAREIEAMSNSHNAMIVGKLPFNKIPTEAMIVGKTVVEYASNTFTSNIEEMWSKVKEVLKL
ncbi:ATP-binding protein [Methanohalophilus sp.]|uniref:ATP-binding protein n=1 Tax=Methanohalophilus sp. TaxID=1966352 RepID=UPI0026279446|nr:ATP-binding protein [Methanohalophilus sp.]MDK2891655.1 hypothetical protein [Methanohalophilus sp.]